MDDYLYITLTDEQDVPDALARLRVIYPNLMQLDYDNQRTRQQQEICAPERTESISRWSIWLPFTSCKITSP